MPIHPMAEDVELPSPCRELHQPGVVERGLDEDFQHAGHVAPRAATRVELAELARLFVYLDIDPDLDEVMTRIIAWWEKVVRPRRLREPRPAGPL